MFTRRGDRGETSLYGARRTAKDSPRVEAYGTIDELNALLGVAISECTDRKISGPLVEVQKMLFVAGTDCASELGGSKEVPRIAAGDTSRLEHMTLDLLKGLPSLRNFILPGGGRVGASLQFARAVCRRAERRILTASKVEDLNPELLPFFNRLSSFLFNLSRYANLRQRKKETIWKG